MMSLITKFVLWACFVTTTLALTDCRISCSFLSLTPTSFGSGKFLDTILMPAYFQIQFDVSLNQLPFEVGSMVGIIDPASGQSLFKVLATNTRNIRTVYNGIAYGYGYSSLNLDYANTYTTVLAGYNNLAVFSTTSNDYNTVDSSVTMDFVNTTSRQFDLYIAEINDGSSSTAEGFIKNIIISAADPAPTVLPTQNPTSPTEAPTAAPTDAPSTAPTYLIQDCREADCSVFWGSLFALTPNQIVARFYLPSDFQISFDLRRPVLSGADNNVFELRAANAPADSESLLSFSLASQSVTNLKYNGNLVQGPGVVAGYSSTFTSFSVMYIQGSLSMRSSAAPSTTTSLSILGAPVNTGDTVYYLYASGPNSVAAFPAPVLRSFTVGVARPSPSAPPTIMPSTKPSATPTAPSAAPTLLPSIVPSVMPSVLSTSAPSDVPTESPTEGPTVTPTATPTPEGTEEPTVAPSDVPSADPSGVPISTPSEAPTIQPSPVLTVEPTQSPTQSPSQSPSAVGEPSQVPTIESTTSPNVKPTVQPSVAPSINPSRAPTAVVSAAPSVARTNAPTAAIKSINAVVLLTNLEEYSATESTVQVTIAALPSKELVLTFTANSVTDTAVLYPGSVTFTSASSSTTAKLAFAAGSAGTYNIVMTVSGASAAEYQVTSGALQIRVVGTEDDILVAPQMTSARFSADGSTVSVVFDIDTNQAGMASAVVCSKLLAFAGDTVHTCQWADAKTVMIYPTSKVTAALRLSLTSAVTLRTDNTVRALCTQASTICATLPAAASVTVLVLAPLSPQLPAVSLAVPAKVSGCADLTVDLTASTGAGGRAWAPPTFTVSVFPADASVSAVIARLDSTFAVSPRQIVPNALLARQGTYTIAVTLCNFLGACGNATRTVEVNKDGGNMPVVSIAGLAHRNVLSSAGLRLSATAFTASCNGSISYNHLSSSWAVFENDIAVSNPQSVSKDALTFRLAAFALSPLHTYTVVYTARNTLTGLSASTSVNVVVDQAPLTAVIQGGFIQSVPLNGSILLDASSSTDGDVATAKGSAAGLLFSWGCHQTSPAVSATCPLDLNSISASQQKLRLFASSRATNTTSVVTVTVTDVTHTRSTSSTVYIRVLAPSAPLVAISTDASSLAAVNVNNVLTLSGKVTTSSVCTAAWAVNSTAVSLSTSSLTPVTTAVTAGTTKSFALVLSSNALPERSALMFTLSCGISSAQIAVTTNGPPTPGAFRVSPTSGYEVTTTFELSASVWSDADLPLTYQFGFMSGGAVMVVQGRSESSYASTYLPAGSAEAAYALDVVALVYDWLNAYATATSSVTVASNQPASMVQNALLTQLNASTSNTAATKNVLALGGAVLNAVNCSLALQCDAINRSPCSKVAGTCGECLAGYVGESGASNTPCVTVADVPKVASLQGCSQDSDCGVWEFCDTVASMCVLRSKSCVDDCSGHGECVWINANTKQPVQACTVLDPYCAAECACAEGYGGYACAYSTSSVAQKRSTRAEFLVGLSAVTQSDDVSAETVAAWSVNLQALSQDPHELSADSLDSINSLAQAVLTGASSSGDLSYESTVGVLNAVDVATQASGNTTSLNSTSAVLNTLRQFGDLIGSQLAPAQDGVELVYTNFRIAAVKQSADSNVTLSVPQTGLEKSLGQSASSVEVAGVADESEGELAVSVIATTAGAYSALHSELNSNPLRVSISSSTERTLAVAVKLIHNAATKFTNASTAGDMVFNTTCDRVENTGVYEFTCPGLQVLTHNCSGLNGVLTSYCPVLAPSCSVLDSATGSLNQNSTQCVVAAFDAWSTTCQCNMTSAENGRRLSSALAESGVLDVVSSSVYLANSFVNTFHSADDLNSLEDLRQVLIVIIMFATLWAGGIILICGCAWRQRVLQKTNIAKKAGLERKKQSAQISRSPAAVRQYLVDYVIETFPSVFSNKPFLSRMYGEVKRHHRYLTLFTAPPGESGDKQRILTGVQLLTVQTMLMFLLSLLYDVQGPVDDGTCVYYTTEATCLHKKSPFDSSQAYCDWSPVPNQPGAYACGYQEPQFTFQVIIYIAVMVSLLVALIQYPVDRLFELLTAPIADDLKLSAQDSTLKRAGRRISNVARRASNAALNVAQAAKTKLADARASIVGSDTRKIPESTEAAHALAAATVSVIAETSRLALQDRQLARLRLCHEFSQRKISTSHHSDSDLESGGESMSDSSSDDDTVDSKVQVRRPGRAAASPTNDGPARTQPSTDSKGYVSVPSAQTVTQTTLIALRDEITYQRRLLKTWELEEFDSQWGIDPMGEFLQGEKSLVPCVKGKASALELIAGELEFVQKETAAKHQKLQVATDAHTGLEILHLFIMDLLGRRTPAARIFETKSAEDFEHTKVVSKNAKYMAALGLVGLNGFFIYYALLTGFQRGLSWQRMYLTACIVQFFVEIFLFETMECLWINCMVPMLVSGEVRTVGDSIIEIIQKLCSSEGYVQNDLFLNAPDYLFVSTNVAKKFPTLVESILVQAYSSHLPGELAKTWQVGAFARIHRRHQSLRSGGVLAVVLGILQYWATAPFVFHRMIVRFVQPFTFSALALLWEFVIASDVNIAVTTVVLAAALVAAAYWGYRSQQQSVASKISMVHENDEIAQSMKVSGKRGAMVQRSEEPTTAEEVKVEYALPVVTVLDSASVMGSNIDRSHDSHGYSSDTLESPAIPMMHSPFANSPMIPSPRGSPRTGGSPFTSPSGMLRFRKKFTRKSVGKSWNQQGASDAEGANHSGAAEGFGASNIAGGLCTLPEHSDLGADIAHPGDSHVPIAPITSPNSLHNYTKRFLNRPSVTKALSSVSTDYCPSIGNFSELSAEQSSSSEGSVPPPPPEESPAPRWRFDSDCINSMERGSNYFASGSSGSEKDGAFSPKV